MYFLEPDNLKFEVSEIYRGMGSRGNLGEGNEEIDEAIEKVHPLAMELIRARCVYNVVSSKVDDKKQVILDENLPLNTLSRFFEGAGSAAIAVATIGSELEREVSRLFKEQEFIEALALDAFGFVALEKCFDVLRETLLTTIPGAKKLGPSLSPGCQRIPLEEQKIIFSLVETKKIGVSLTDSFQMLPIKSCSVIIPVGQNLKMSAGSVYGCELCDIHNKCTYSHKE